ncbi:hypothetical protein [Bacillus mycoides]|uniref:hypothetical protein n=1 Tax=Bacillus mycoides TaxID=1405 RepID=UPI000991950F|nr:hypothetical protein [Bacillus mycoides]OOR66058.1 hypothetical protein BLW98_24040 [Bacillus mycoides]
MANRKVHNDGLTPKQRYFKKVYDEAPMIECVCGCGEMIKSKDKYGRDKKYINGHNGRKYTTPNQYKLEWNYRHREQRYAYRKKRAYEIRVNFINKLGGKCIKCGLEHGGMNTPAFDFHHVDPNSKNFNVNMNSINHYSLSKLEEEVNKCELICANCHRIHHWQEQFDFME